MEETVIDNNRSTTTTTNVEMISHGDIVKQKEPLVVSRASSSDKYSDKTQKSMHVDVLKERLENLKHIRKSSGIVASGAEITKSFTKEDLELELEMEFEVGRIIASHSST